MFRRALIIALFSVNLLVPAQAEVLVLVHGLLGDSTSFQRAGVTTPLLDKGWRMGMAGRGPQGPMVDLIPNPGAQSFYSVDLPSQAPIAVQALWLQAYLQHIQAHHEGEPVTLVGHSAGGVVARLALVQHGAANVVRLITIASPHLGTQQANRAMDATSGGGLFSPLKSFFVQRAIGSSNYQLLGQSRAVLADLTMAGPGNLLGWLNQQPHPDIEYISVVRANTQTYIQDVLVPSVSQDMGRVAALQGRSRLIVTADQHFLSPRDGQLLLQLFDR